jgi:MbtH protein
MGSWPRHQHFRVVVNDEGQYGIWPVDNALPSGWRAVGFAGTRPSCLDYVAEIWRDMRPLSVQNPPFRQGPEPREER